MSVQTELIGAQTCHPRGLAGRHLQLMGMGGAIGAGFLLGSGSAIHSAGAGLLLTYLLAGAAMYLMMRALGEVALADPAASSFSTYAMRYLGALAGFITGWSYWVAAVLVGMAEITAVGILLRHWYPDIPQWLPALTATVLLYAINMCPVRSFGEVEYWLAMIKVVTLLGVLVCGVAILFLGLGEVGQHAGISNLWTHGGFFPSGFSGVLAALPVVLFAFGGVEVLALAAAETDRPEQTLPPAVRGLFCRILIIYVGSLAIVMMLFPWNSLDPATSPFIVVLQRAGLPAAQNVLTFVAITAVLSAGNSVLFASSRMLRALANAGQAPAWLNRSSRQGTPQLAVSASAAAMAIGVVLNYLMPERVLGNVMQMVSWLVLMVWAVIMLTHLAYRRALSRGEAKGVSFRLPGAPYSNWLVLATIGFSAFEMAVRGSGAISLCILLAWFALLIFASRAAAGRMRRR